MNQPLSKHIKRLFPHLHEWSRLEGINTDLAFKYWNDNDEVERELNEYNSIIFTRAVDLGGTYNIHKID